MNIEELIKNAKQKRNEAYRKNSVQTIVYWDGYLDALSVIEILAAENERLRADLETRPPKLIITKLPDKKNKNV